MGCGNCKKDCGSCGGCGGCGLELTDQEIRVLEDLGQYAFLPVARKAGDMIPVYLEDPRWSQEESSLVLQCLEKKGLISIDYRAPLSGADMTKYAAYPVHGSMALTASGQQVLEQIQLNGIV